MVGGVEIMEAVGSQGAARDGCVKDVNGEFCDGTLGNVINAKRDGECTGEKDGSILCIVCEGVHEGNVGGDVAL